jgi:hypothetical protein
VSTYYTTLKGLWDELDHQEPLACCTCGAVKALQAKHQRQYVYQFLIDLNESYSHIRGQILLLDPLPPTNKVFSLVLQEERQRALSISSRSFNPNTTALLTKANSSNSSRGKGYSKGKDRPVCSHCGITGHTMEKCYRLHGFPPGFQFNKGKNAPSAANQVSSETKSEIPQLPITYDQCQQLMNMFKPSSSETSSSNISAANQVSSTSSQEQLISHMAGSISITSLFSSIDKSHSVFASSTSLLQQTSFTNSIHAPWIIDTGATDHMICTVSLFTTITAVISRTVRLPNGQSASVTHIGTVRISESFILTDVLCVPSFSFNLISVSKLIKVMHCCLIFFVSILFYSAPYKMEDDWSG